MAEDRTSSPPPPPPHEPRVKFTFHRYDKERAAWEQFICAALVGYLDWNRGIRGALTTEAANQAALLADCMLEEWRKRLPHER